MTVNADGSKITDMTKASWQGKSLRTTITMNRKLYKDCRELMELHGYGDNFSAFITDAARLAETAFGPGETAVLIQQRKRSKNE